jgi:hypothetical protein
MEGTFIELDDSSLLKPFNSNDFELTLLKAGRLFREGIFTSYHKLHVKTEDHLSDRNFNHTRLSLYATSCLQMLQALTFLFLGRSELADYESVKLFWEVLAFARGDILFGYLGLLDGFLYLVFVVIGIQLLWLTASVSASIWKGYNYEVKLLPWLASLSIGFSCNYMLLPTLSILLAEVIGVSPVPQINQGSLSPMPWRQTIAGSALVSLLVLMSLNEVFSSEVRHDLSSFDFKARCTARFDLVYRVMLVTLVTCAYVMSGVMPILQYCIVAGMALLAAYCLCKWMPYYHVKANAVKILASISMAWWSLSYIIAYSLQNSVISIVLTVFVTPLLLLALNAGIEARGRKLVENCMKLLDTEKSLFMCELGLRPLILSHHPDVLQVFNLLKLKKDIGNEKMLYIWEAQFCLGVLEDDRLARIKFSRVLEGSGGFEADYHEYALNREFQLNEFVREDVVYLRYKSLLDKVKETDELICNLLYQFWTDFQYFSLSRVRKYISLVHVSLRLLHIQYKALLKDFPNSSTVKELYGSFLNDIGNNVDKGSSLLHKAEAERRALQHDMKATQLSFFDDSNGVMIVSGTPKSFGKIAYCNLEAAEILGYGPIVLRDLQVEALIPPPFSVNHTFKMQKYVTNCTTSELGHSKTLFFLNKSNFLVECYTYLRCSALLSHPSFILLFRQKPSSNQVAIVDAEGCISCHSELFPMYLGTIEVSLTGYSVTKFISNFAWAKLNIPFFCPFAITNSTRMAMLGKLEIGNDTTILVFVFSSEAEADKWEKGSMQEEILNYSFQAESRVQHKASVVEPTANQTSLLNVPEIKGVTFSEGNQVFTLNSIQNSSAGAGIGSLAAASLSKHRRSSIVGDRKLSLVQGKEVEDITVPQHNRLDSSSMNSSFTNNIQFTTSILGKLLIENVKKAVQLFAVSYFVMLIAIILTSTFTAVYFYLTVSSQVNAISPEDLGACMYDIILLADASRKLGESEVSTEMSNLLASDVSASISHLEEVHSRLESKVYDLSEGALKERFLDEWILVWEVMDGQFISSKRNILDTLQLFIDHVSARQGRNFIENVETYSFTDPNFLFLHRNGLGESLAALNSTMYKFGEVAEEKVGNLLTGTFICIGMIGAVYLVCLLITLPKIFQIQTRSSSVWNTLFSVPMGTLVELRRKSLDRLRIYHSVDVDIDESRRFATKQRLVLNDPVWRTFIGLMLLFAGYTLGFYAYIYIMGVSTTTNLLLERSHQVELIYTHRCSLLMTMFWATEVLNVADPSSSLYVLQPQFRHASSPELAFASAYESSHRSRQRFRENLLKGVLPMSSATKTMMFDTVSSEDLELQQGLITAEQDYLEQLSMQTTTRYRTDYVKLIKLERNIQLALGESCSTMLSEIEDKINELSSHTIVLFVLYGILSVGFYLLITLPVLKWVVYRIKQAWRLTSLIPNDVMQLVLKS